MSNLQVLLIQPCYPHGGKKQIYMPYGMLSFASRLMASGVQVRIIDLNLDALNQEDVRWAEVISVAVLGTPYIVSAIKLVQNLRSRGFMGHILVGGQGIARFNRVAFDRLFNSQAIQLHEEVDPADILGVSLPGQETISIVGALKTLSPNRRGVYLSREFPLYLSQGCRFNCNFCAAAKDQREQYRDMTVLAEEIDYIVDELERVGSCRLEAYLSNLDTFQNPEQLEEALTVIRERCQRSGIEVHLRCLSTMAMFAHAARKDPGLPGRLRNLGLKIVAFGADGGDERVWARMGKRHNSLETLREAVEAAQLAGMEVEILMVIGFRDDDALAMVRAFKLSLDWAKYGCVLRPYLGKPPIDHMEPDELQMYVENPELIRNLDYAALGSRTTHPKCLQRWMVNATYLAVIGALTPSGLNTTFPIIPLEGSWARRALAHVVNRFMPVDR